MAINNPMKWIIVFSELGAKYEEVSVIKLFRNWPFFTLISTKSVELMWWYTWLPCKRTPIRQGRTFFAKKYLYYLYKEMKMAADKMSYLAVP